MSVRRVSPASHRLRSPRLLPSLVTTVALSLLAACSPGATDPTDTTPEAAPPTATSQTPAEPEADPGGPVWRLAPQQVAAPAGWKKVAGMLEDAVAESSGQGVTITWCAIAIDLEGSPQVCAGQDQMAYSASLPKVAMGIAAIEAFDGKLDKQMMDYTPWADRAAALEVSVEEAMGQTPAPQVAKRAETSQKKQTKTTLGDLVYAAIKFSDNDAYNQLVDLVAETPAAQSAGRKTGVSGSSATFAYVNSIAARKQLDEGFHVGNYMNVIVGGDWNHLTASGTADYLAAIVSAADGEVADGDLDTRPSGAITTPRAARFVLESMYDQYRTTKIPAELPADTVANKTGETDTESHDMAVLGTESGRLVLVAVSTFWAGAYPPDAEMGPLAEQVVAALGGPASL